MTRISKKHECILQLISFGNENPHKDLNVLMLKDVVSLEMIKLMYNYKHNTLPTALQKMLSDSNHVHNY